MLRRRCNFSCAHCFYNCGTKFRGGMSWDILRKVYAQVEKLQAVDIYPSINLIGGEPTLNLDHFQECLREVMTWDVSVEMTTNGWWLHEGKTAVKFFNIVRPYIDRDGYGDGFCIRISDSNYHDASRPKHLRDGRMAEQLRNIWEYGEPFVRESIVCYDCGKTYKYMPDNDQCTCGEYLEYEYEDILGWSLPEPDPDWPWIYVEDQRRRHFVIPNGRGSNIGTADASIMGYNCANGLTYLPNGKLMDICCKGSWCEFGDVYDHPLVLLETAWRFVEEVKPSCWTCRDDAVEWKRTNLRRTKNEVKACLTAL